MKQCFTKIAGIDTLIVYDNEMNDYIHHCGATLKFSKPICAHEVKFENSREFVILVSNLNTNDLIKAVWLCFFKALGKESDNYENISKEIYSQYFIESFDTVSNIVTRLWEQENECYCEDAREFLDHEEWVLCGETCSNCHNIDKGNEICDECRKGEL